MSFAHPLWLFLTIAAVVWYSTITIYVAVKGAGDIKHMLKSLGEHETNDVKSEV